MAKKKKAAAKSGAKKSKVHLRGFASMDKKLVKSLSSKGGRAAHKAGTAHQFSSSEARKAANARWKTKKKKK